MEAYMSEISKVQVWRNRIKECLIQALGGKCCRCGYNRCKRALHCHHLGDKINSVSSMLKNPKKIPEIVAEAKKCILLCSNCHSELHDDIWSINSIILPKFDDSINFYVLAPKTPKFACKICNKPSFNKKYCSRKCMGKNFAKSSPNNVKNTRWPKPEVIIDLLETESYVNVGKKYNVTDNAVRQYLRRNNIVPPKKHTYGERTRTSEILSERN